MCAELKPWRKLEEESVQLPLPPTPHPLPISARTRELTVRPTGPITPNPFAIKNNKVLWGCGAL